MASCETSDEVSAGYKGKKTLQYKPNKEQVKFFTDADWASDIKDRKSFGGYIAILAGGAVSWTCKKQQLVALSTVEPEFTALGEAVREALWMRGLLREMQLQRFCENATKIFIDNQGAMALAQNKIASERTKHLYIRSFFVQNVIETGEIDLEYVTSESNVADGLTKGIKHSRLVAHNQRYGLSDQGGGGVGI